MKQNLIKNNEFQDTQQLVETYMTLLFEKLIDNLIDKQEEINDEYVFIEQINEADEEDDEEDCELDLELMSDAEQQNSEEQQKVEQQKQIDQIQIVRVKAKSLGVKKQTIEAPNISFFKKIQKTNQQINNLEILNFNKNSTQESSQVNNQEKQGSNNGMTRHFQPQFNTDDKNVSVFGIHHFGSILKKLVNEKKAVSNEIIIIDKRLSLKFQLNDEKGRNSDKTQDVNKEIEELKTKLQEFNEKKDFLVKSLHINDNDISYVKSQIKLLENIKRSSVIQEIPPIFNKTQNKKKSIIQQSIEKRDTKNLDEIKVLKKFDTPQKKLIATKIEKQRPYTNSPSQRISLVQQQTQFKQIQEYNSKQRMSVVQKQTQNKQGFNSPNQRISQFQKQQEIKQFSEIKQINNGKQSKINNNQLPFIMNQKSQLQNELSLKKQLSQQQTLNKNFSDEQQSFKRKWSGNAASQIEKGNKILKQNQLPQIQEDK